MTNLECAKLVYNMIKIIRGYLGSAILATQEMNDFLRGMQEYGESVLNNTALVILLRMNENDLNRVAGTYKLSSDECEKILKFRHGDLFGSTENPSKGKFPRFKVTDWDFAIPKDYLDARKEIKEAPSKKLNDGENSGSSKKETIQPLSLSGRFSS